jgi:hypothetical protein
MAVLPARSVATLEVVPVLAEVLELEPALVLV